MVCYALLTFQSHGAWKYSETKTQQFTFGNHNSKRKTALNSCLEQEARPEKEQRRRRYHPPGPIGISFSEMDLPGPFSSFLVGMHQHPNAATESCTSFAQHNITPQPTNISSCVCPEHHSTRRLQPRNPSRPAEIHAMITEHDPTKFKPWIAGGIR